MLFIYEHIFKGSVQSLVLKDFWSFLSAFASGISRMARRSFLVCSV